MVNKTSEIDKLNTVELLDILNNRFTDPVFLLYSVSRSLGDLLDQEKLKPDVRKEVRHIRYKINGFLRESGAASRYDMRFVFVDNDINQSHVSVTSSLKTIYKDAEANASHTNPIVLDGNGLPTTAASIWLNIDIGSGDTI